MRTISPRNKLITENYLADPNLTIEKLADAFGLTTQRVSAILKRYRIVRLCSNCFHSNNGFCSCREAVDIVRTPNKCADWRPNVTR